MLDAARQKVLAATASRDWPMRLALCAILLLAGLLRTLWLSQNGYGRTYYAAGVRSMLESWHNFFFNAFDPAGFVSLDKPPIALWLQAASAKLIGFSGVAMLLPQVIEGLIAILLVYVLVKRSFGAPAGLLAALFLALTPISVAVDRSNNTDSCLVMVLLVAFWLFARALQTQRAGFLLASMACVGVAFNVKMGAALVLVPAIALTYLLFAQFQPLLRRMAWLGMGGIALLAVSLSWAVIFDLTPADNRPYAGSTQHNSMLELALVHNGVARFSSRADSGPPASVIDDEQIVAAEPPEQGVQPPLWPLWDDSPIGALRLLRPHQAVQVSWLLPLALAGLLLGVWQHREHQLSRLQRASLALWGGWLLSYWIVFSYAGGVFHTYYLAALAPPLCALAGIAIAQLWRRSSPRLLAGSLALATAWMAYLSAGAVRWQLEDFSAWLYAGTTATACAGCLVLLAPAPMMRKAGIQRAALACTLAALLVAPSIWSLSVVLVRPNVAAPAADIAALMRPAAEASDRAARARRAEARRNRLIAFLRARHGKERFIVAVPNALQAAPIIVATGKPVMAIGGYLGRDPILSPADLQKLAQRDEVRFVVIGGPSLAPADHHQQAITQWVRANGTIVDRSLWLPRASAATAAAAARGARAGTAPFVAEPAELYDLRPKSTHSKYRKYRP